MNNNQYWCGPELSSMLEELGVESQFDLWWACDIEGNWIKCTEAFMEMEKYSGDKHAAFHFSDILLPENAKKIWGEDEAKTLADQPWYRSSEAIVYIIANGVYGNWHSWLEGEVEKVLKVPGYMSCGSDCHYTDKYGFVPEADCKIHD